MSLAGASHAGDKEQCAAAYSETQSLRDKGKLIQAREQARACSAAACAAFIVKDCAQWLAEIEAALPTVVFAAQGPSGADTTSVRVSIDGKVAAEALDGQAVALDPGPHKLRFETAGAEPIDLEVVARQGGKLRRVGVSFQTRAALAADPAAPAAPASSPGPWIVGGIGVAALIVGGVTGGLVLQKKSAFDATVHRCSVGGTQTDCTTAAGASARSAIDTLGPVTTVALVAGGAALAGAAIWLGVRGRGSTTARIGVAPAHAGASLRLEGAW
jgi:hypothetical protein